MNKKKLTIAVALAFILAFTFILVDAKAVYADETRLVRIYGGEEIGTKAVRLEPDVVTIKGGGIVIWANWALASKTKVVFEKGKMCSDVTESPMGFTMDAKECYVTWVPFGGTASLKFNERGTYNYFVETGKGVKSSGRIDVR